MQVSLFLVALYFFLPYSCFPHRIASLLAVAVYTELDQRPFAEGWSNTFVQEVDLLVQEVVHVHHIMEDPADLEQGKKEDTHQDQPV